MGVGDEVLRRCIARQKGGALDRGEHHDGVVQDGGAAVDVLIGWDECAVGDGGTADLGGDDLEHRSFGLDRSTQRGQDGGLGAVSDKGSDLAAGEGRWTVVEDAQRG